MKKQTFFVVFTMFASIGVLLTDVLVNPATASTPVPSWVARSNGLGAGNLDGEPRAMVLDAAGNSYVTGQSGGDYYTVKYDADGNEIWAARYESPECCGSEPAALTLDSAGNVYVTGESVRDFATVKYDPDGNELWAARYQGLLDLEDGAADVVVDAGGNVYVTGYSTVGSIGDPPHWITYFTTIKYNANGNRLWVKQFGTWGYVNYYAKALELDSSGNIYVTGWAYNAGGGATVKYDPDGNELWAVQTPMNPPVDLAVDAAGNVVVSGQGHDNVTHYDIYTTIKYDTDGNELWSVDYAASTDGASVVTDLALDVGGNVYVTGEATGGITGHSDFATIKYDENGNEVWVARYEGPDPASEDRPHSLAVDAAGYVYVTGGCDVYSRVDFATVKYDPGGNELWVKLFNGPDENAHSEAVSLAVDVSGNVYVTGWYDGYFSSPDYATLKYDTDGNELWNTLVEGPFGLPDDSPKAMALDDAGNIYVTGILSGEGYGEICSTVKYGPQGDELWVDRYGGPSDEITCGESLAVDDAGNLYVTGYLRDSASYGQDFATIKYDPYGNELWIAYYMGPTDGWDTARSLAVDAVGNVYVTGSSLGDGTGWDVVTIKYDAGGNELWTARYDGPASGDDDPGSLAVDELGNVYVTGSSEGIGTNSDYATIKYDTDGNELWIASYDGPVGGTDVAGSLVIDAFGSVYVTGYSSGGGSAKEDYATIKYDADGNELWTARYNGPASETDMPGSLAADGLGNVFVTGSSEGIDTSYDYATIKYDPDGIELWTARYNGPGDDYDGAESLALDAFGNIYVTGSSQGDGTQADYATIKYDTDGIELWTIRYNGPGNFYDSAESLALDAGDNIYVMGLTNDFAAGTEWAVIKYAQVDPPPIPLPAPDEYGNVPGGDPGQVDEVVFSFEGKAGDVMIHYEAYDVDDESEVRILVNGEEVAYTAVTGEGEWSDIRTILLPDMYVNDSEQNFLIFDSTRNPPDTEPWGVRSILFCADLDGDGYGNPASAECGHPEPDCDDSNPDVNPGMTEIPGNGLDDDCDPNTPSWGTPAAVVNPGPIPASNITNALAMMIVPLGAVMIWRRLRRRAH